MSVEPISEFKQVTLIADLDALVNERVGFKLNQKTYILKPVTAEDLMEMERARRKLVLMVESRGEGVILPQDEIYERYFDFINCVVTPGLTMAEVQALTLTQLNALTNLIFRQLAGDASLFEKKKQTLRGL